MSGAREYYGFTLFYNDRKTGKQPEYKGDGTLDPATIAYIVECHANGTMPQLEMVGWVKTGKSGTKFQSILVNKHWKVRKEEEEAGGQQRAPAARQAPAARKPTLPGMDDDGDIPF